MLALLLFVRFLYNCFIAWALSPKFMVPCSCSPNKMGWLLFMFLHAYVFGSCADSESLSEWVQIR